MSRLALGIVLVAACGSSKSSGGGGTTEVQGTLVVDGKPQTITKCIVERHLDTRITLVFAGGSVSYEDDDWYLYRGDDDDGIMRGSRLTCSDSGGEHYTGTSTGKPGWARGTLRADCSAPAPVKLDVTLSCGTLDPDQQKRLDELKASMRDQAAAMSGTGSGSAAPADALDAGATAPSTEPSPTGAATVAPP